MTISIFDHALELPGHDKVLLCVNSKTQIRVDPEFFSEAEFINRLVTTECGNVDLCLLNAAKVVERVSEYYRDCLQ